MDAVEYCFACGTYGFFLAEDSLLCPECNAKMMGVAIAKPSDDFRYPDDVDDYTDYDVYDDGNYHDYDDDGGDYDDL